MHIQRWVILVTLLFNLIVLGGCHPQQPLLTIGSNSWPGYRPLYLAREMGYYDERQIRLHEFANSQVAMRAFRNGAIDVVAVTLDEAVSLAALSDDIRIFHIFDFSAGADAILARPPIQNVAALKGARVGVETTATGAYLLARGLELNALTSADVAVRHIPFEQHVQAYRDGSVDALVTFEPARSQLLALGARQVFSSREIPREVIDVLVTRRGVLASHADAIQRLLVGHYHARDLIVDQPEEAARILAEAALGDPAELMQAWRLMELPNRAVVGELLDVRQSYSLVPQIQRIGQVMRRAGILVRDLPDPARLLDVAPLREQVRP